MAPLTRTRGRAGRSQCVQPDANRWVDRAAKAVGIAIEGATLDQQLVLQAVASGPTERAAGPNSWHSFAPHPLVDSSFIPTVQGLPVHTDVKTATTRIQLQSRYPAGARGATGALLGEIRRAGSSNGCPMKLNHRGHDDPTVARGGTFCELAGRGGMMRSSGGVLLGMLLEQGGLR